MAVRSAALQKLLNRGRRGNPLSRLARLEQQSMGGFLREPSAPKLSDITQDLGTIVQGAFISPASISASAEPTSTDFTGVAMGGDGWEFDGKIYNFCGVEDGELQVGIGTTDGLLVWGGLNGYADATGLHMIPASAGYSPANSVRWEKDGNLYGAVSDYYVSTSGYNILGVSCYAQYASLAHSKISLYAQASTSNDSEIQLYAGTPGTEVPGVGAGLNLYSATGHTVVETGFFGLGTPTELTISGGIVTATRSYHTIDTEGDAATDELDTINGGNDGDILILKSANAGRDPTLKDGTGNLYLAGDFTLSTIQDMIMLMYRSTLSGWAEISRSDNA